MAITLDEAIESAKLSAGKERILRQQHYSDLLNQLPEEERFTFTMALAELDIGPRTGNVAASAAVAEFLRSGAVRDILRQNTGLDDRAIENRLVKAAMHRDAQWWQNLKDRFKNWWSQGPEDEYQEEFGEPFPEREPGTEDMYSMEPKEVIEPMAEPAPPGYGPGPEPNIPPPPEEMPGPPVEPVGIPVTEEPPPPPPGFEDKRDMPEMIPVKSSNLEAVGYIPEEELLYIIFAEKRSTPRTLYRYSNVSQSEFDDLLAADSQGKYFHQYIRNTKPYTGPIDPGAYGL
jgi:hypothetical protein